MASRIARGLVLALAVGAGLLTLLFWGTFFVGAAGYGGAYVLGAGFFTALIATALFLFWYGTRDQAREDRARANNQGLS